MNDFYIVFRGLKTVKKKHIKMGVKMPPAGFMDTINWRGINNPALNKIQ